MGFAMNKNKEHIVYGWESEIPIPKEQCTSMREGIISPYSLKNPTHLIRILVQNKKHIHVCHNLVSYVCLTKQIMIWKHFIIPGISIQIICFKVHREVALQKLIKLMYPIYGKGTHACMN